MEKNDSKRSLADYAHYFFSDDNSSTEVCAEESSQGGSVIRGDVCALCHSALTDEVSPIAVLEVSQLVQTVVTECIIITSPYNKENVLSQTERFGFRCVRQEPWELYRSHNGRMQVVVISEYLMLRTLFANHDNESGAQKGEQPRLFLIDSAAFGIDFLDRLSALYDMVITLSPLDTAAVLESYQQVKAYAAVAQSFESVVFIVDDTVDKRFSYVKETLARLGADAIGRTIHAAPVIAGGAGLVKTGESDTVLESVFAAVDARRGDASVEDVYRERLGVFVVG